MTLEIKKFDPSKLGDGCVIVMIAKRASGKSVLIKDLLFHKRKSLPSGVVFAGTESGNGFFGKFIPDLFVYNEFDADALGRLVNQQRRLSKQGRADPAFVILDDCAFDRKFMNSKLMRECIFNGRHYGLWICMSSQWAMDLPPSFRSNIDYVFILKDNLYRERLHKNFFPFIPTLDTFNRIMDVCTADYGCLVLDNNSHSTNISECIYHYKAKPDRDFKMGSAALWGFHKQKYNSKYDDEDDVAPPSKKGGKVSMRITKG
jgi:hypothetical protein